MSEFSLIFNTGIQFFEPEQEVVIDLNASVMKALRFLELQVRNTIFLDPVYYFPLHDKYLRRQDLLCGGYMNPETAEIAPEEVINNNMNWLDDEKLLSINRLNVTIGDKKLSGLDQIENHWIPIPMYEEDPTGAINYPTNWCRIKLIPIEGKCTTTRRHYRLVMALDTSANPNHRTSAPHFNGQPFKKYSLCGYTNREIAQMPAPKQKLINTILIPLKVYEFADDNKNPWVNTYLREIFHSTELTRFEPGQRLKYIAYYIYFVTYLHQLNVVPEVKLFNDAAAQSIQNNLVLDVGNSRTFGLVAEDPLNASFSKSSILEMTNLDNGKVYDKPFDMRLCFKDERFGMATADGEFRWPSLVRLGEEAILNIYNGDQDLMSAEQFDTSHSSPKRYLWDMKPFQGQWKFVSEKDRVVGPSQTVFMEGVSQQFSENGTFVTDPDMMGEHFSYSRSSLMTFAFLEILLQARMQINSVKFRQKNGNESRKREIARVIITCPTAMSRQEQRTLRKCMQDASIVLSRFYSKTYNEKYNPDQDHHKIEIIPSVKDLSLSGDNLDMRRNWNYDEATCCQMVYLYSEIRRYLGNSREFFDMYGRYHDPEEEKPQTKIPSYKSPATKGNVLDEKPKEKSLTIASIDIGAGTTDIMICNYRNSGESIVPTPLFWDSYHTAGDELIKKIITDVLLGFPNPQFPGASGIVTEKLRSLGNPDIANTMHHFFDDTQAMGVIEKRMRKEFTIQVLIPIANYLLSLLQKDEDDKIVTYEEIFQDSRPAESLMDFFAKQMGFRFEELPIKYSKEFLNQIVKLVFEPSFRKFAAIFYSYKCDIVLMAGRPCSIKQINRLLRRLHAVAPNRLISMNDYRVGSWYPGSTDVGHFGDKKSLVAVGALISYLAENGKLPMFKLTTENLKMKVAPTADYIGLIKGTLDNILTPECNSADVEIGAFPIALGFKQLNVPGYPYQMLYQLDFNEDFVRQRAVSNLIARMNLPKNTPESEILPDYIAQEVDTLKFRSKQNSPLRFRLEREYYTDKELIKIDSVENSIHDELPKNMFKLTLQSWSDDESNWLDTGKFILAIRN